MSAASRRNEHQQAYLRQATILRKNLVEWDQTIRSPQGANWPSMLGRLNAAMNQSSNLDKCIEPVLEHFVYVPKKCTANPQDIPFFLSTRLATDAQKQKADTAAASGADKDGTKKEGGEEEDGETGSSVDVAMAETEIKDPVKALKDFENVAAELAADYESKMMRF
mmetsp:Transcript_840/g.2337  ORF Transcript_840/g.2337 Transcript_840/m.2337 type:complete len:166 (+) Transcript_840:162-659(+)